MSRTKKVKSSGRFGARYGRSVRLKMTDIESVQRKKQECIFCNGIAKRLSKGIWKCKKCNKTFASHTYFLPKKEEQNKTINL
ncbi:MAG: 50S ribosomal protein L37ae [Candidatus Pacearchaeota archaeon]|jgi:large subunit ribosomal protein L37Ae